MVLNLEGTAGHKGYLFCKNKWVYVACYGSFSRLPVSLFSANHYFRFRFLRALRGRRRGYIALSLTSLNE